MGGLKHVLFRTAAVLATGLGLSLTTAALANAAAPQPVPATELSKATTAAGSPTALSLLGKAAAASSNAKAATAKPTIGRDASPVYALNPAFVRDATAPVATFWYAATTATRGTDRLTVYTAPDAKGTWQAVNVATGDTEARMFTAARGALVFTEPQISAWYALTGNQIRPLNASAAKSIGTAPITVKAYQDLVAKRYADKQAGSTYSETGTAGGYDTTTVTTAATPHQNYAIPATATGAALLLGVGFFIRRRTT